jgi:hypothetical protein
MESNPLGSVQLVGVLVVLIWNEVLLASCPLALLDDGQPTKLLLPY